MDRNEPTGPQQSLDRGAARSLALVEAIGRTLFQRRSGDPREGLELAFEQLGAAAALKAVVTVWFEPAGDLTVTGCWVEGGGTVDVVGTVVPASELPDHVGLRTGRRPMTWSSDDFGPAYGALLAGLGSETSLLGVPVLSGDDVVGAMVVVDAAERAWDDDLLVALSVVAERVFGFLARCETEYDLRGRAEAAELLARIGALMSSDETGVLLETLELVTEEIGWFTDATSITHYDIVDGRAEPFVRWSPHDGFESLVGGATAIDVGADDLAVLVDHRILRFTADSVPVASALVPRGSPGILAASLVGTELTGAIVIAHDTSGRHTGAGLDLLGGVVDLLGQFRARMRTERTLDRRRRIEGVRAEIAATFVEAAEGDVDGVVVAALERIGELFETSNVNWLELDHTRAMGHLGATWIDGCEEGAPPGATDFAVDAGLLSERDPHVMTVTDVASRAESSARRPMLVVPTSIADRIVGALAIELADPDVLPPADEMEWLVDIGRLVNQVREHAADAAAARRRERLDDLQLTLAARFLDPEAGETTATIEWAMEELGRELGADVISIVELEGGDDHRARSWTATSEGRAVVESFDDGSATFASFWANFILAGEPIVVTGADLDASIALRLNEAATGGFTMMAAPRRGSEADLAVSATVLCERTWTADELAALRHVAGQFRQFLDTRSARDKVERRLALDGLITAASARLVESPEPVAEAATTVELVGEFFDARSVAWVDVREAENRLVTVHAWQSASVVDLAEPLLPIDLSPEAFSAVVESLVRPFVVNGNDLGDELKSASPESVGLVHVVVPVVVRGRPEALFVIQTDADLRWTDTELSAINSLATVLHEVLDRDRADRLFSTTFRSAPTGQLLVAADGRILAANESFRGLVGVDPDGHRLDRFFEHAPTPDVLVEGELQVVGAGNRPWTRVRTAEVRVASDVEPLTIIHVEDATTDRLNRERLRWEATHDDLTGIANRRVLIDELTSSLAGPGASAILMIDIDRFKVVNDSLGHNAGDSVLVRIAERLRLSLRASDMVCRFGGDEFAVLVRDQVAPMELAATAQRLIDLLRLPVDVDGTAIVPTCSVGVAVARAGDDVETVMRHADAALYEAKTLGRDRFEIFDDTRRDLISDRLQLETSLRQAFMADQFLPWFQPEHDLETGEIIGLEALVRWKHPEQGIIAARDFIDVAEEMGLAPKLSRMVLDRSLLAVRGWLDDGHHTRVRVNVAAAQLQSAELHDQIREGLERFDLDPQHLCIEITERSLMLDPSSAGETLELVRAMGVEVAIDDFGTGFSSLARLKDLPVDTLKIDRSFVAGIDRSVTDREIVRTIIGLGRGLGLDVVAEGVETHGQASLLRELGCRRAQGWLWSRAIDGTDVPTMLLDHTRVR